jgi:hypothetical protein
MSTIEIREHRPGEPGQDLEPFIRAPHLLFEGDRHWVPPLHKEMRDRLSPQKNPFFDHAQVVLFTAWKHGTIVGRCSAQVDHQHLARHQDATGFFGFFDTTDDDEVGRALIGAASEWLRRRGMKKIRGPLSLSINEEVGMLVEGFDSPPMIMMPYSKQYQSRVAESAGLVKAKDLLAWKYEAGELPKRAKDAWEAVQHMPEVRFRSVRPSRMHEDLPIILDVFNDAWKDNWGFVPATPAEAKKAADDFKLIIEPELAFIAEIHGQPSAICVAIPNMNEAIADLNGRLFPVGLFKLLWRMKVKHPSGARLMMLGVREEVRKQKKYGGLSMAMYAEIHRRGTAIGYHWGELSWTLEDNAPVSLGIRAMGGKVYKKYRIFEKSLEEGDVDIQTNREVRA